MRKFFFYLTVILVFLLPYGVLGSSVSDVGYSNVGSYADNTTSGLGFLILGGVVESSTLETGLTAFSILNDGTVAVDVTVSGTDLIGGTTWTLSDTATAGVNTYGLKVGLGSYNIIVRKTAAYNTLVSDLAVGASQSFGIQFLAPTSFSDGVVKTGTLNLTVTAH